MKERKKCKRKREKEPRAEAKISRTSREPVTQRGRTTERAKPRGVKGELKREKKQSGGKEQGRVTE